MSWIDNALAVDSQVLMLRAKRAEVLAANIANADTPGYKAKEVSFQSILEEMRGGAAAAESTREGHFALTDPRTPVIVERPPVKMNANGNTVSREFEQSAFTQNSIQYMASLQFLNGSIQGILTALKGDRA